MRSSAWGQLRGMLLALGNRNKEVDFIRPNILSRLSFHMSDYEDERHVRPAISLLKGRNATPCFSLYRDKEQYNA